MSDLSQFQRFAIQSKKQLHNKNGKAVIYTRVSTKEQAENNKSLVTQKKYCEKFAEKKGIEVIEYFGGTYESAKSDERKEFNKMLTFAKRNKDVSYIIVYSYDRFSRTGANGAYISEQLKKQGIVTLSATQEVDVESASGSFQQNLYYLFSQFDNELRRDKSVTGMREKLRNGYWIGPVPVGYTNLNPGKGKIPNIVVNEEGKILRNAFIWKATENLTNVEIEERLEKLGLKIEAKKFSSILRNPFYCGLIVSGHIAGEVVEGKHEAMISKQMFLRIQQILEKHRVGYRQKKDCEELPLKQFVRSKADNMPYTGYIVKSKGLYYYKNQRKGSKENRSAKIMHQKFEALLSNYELSNKNFLPVLRDMLINMFVEKNKEKIEFIKKLEKDIESIDQKIDRLEERYVFEEITKVQYEKFSGKLKEDRKSVLIDLKKFQEMNLSNLDFVLEKAMDYALNLSKLWTSGDLKTKRMLQHMIFPDGILFDFKNDDYRTLRVNQIFDVIGSLSRFNNGDLAKQKTGFPKKSRSVPRTGFEPART